MREKLYPKLRPWELEPHYSRHVGAMTSEELHHKADIAEQLAWRDQRLAAVEAERDALRAQLAKVREQLDYLVAHYEAGSRRNQISHCAGIVEMLDQLRAIAATEGEGEK